MGDGESMKRKPIQGAFARGLLCIRGLLVDKTRLLGRMPGLVGVLMLSACALTPPESADIPLLPTQWQSAQYGPVAEADALGQDAVTERWWESFDSPALETVVQQVLAGNLDLEAAAARVEQAKAVAHMAGSELWPTLSAALEASRQGGSGGSYDNRGHTHSVGLAASYEVDLWGGLRAGGRAAVSRAQASGFDQHAARLSISAQAASDWVRWVALHERLMFAQANLASALRLLEIVEARQAAGAETRLAVAQQRTLVASQRSEIASLRQATAQAGARLLSWVGQADWEIPRSDSLLQMRVPSIDAGLPSTLLTRRPDIAAAEARLRAAEADVLVARAAMLPGLSLSATAASHDGHFSRLLANPVYTLAAGLVAPIFNGGRLSAAHDQTLAQQRELLAVYRQTILVAFSDTQAALDGVRGSEEQAKAQQQELQQARETLTLAESRYRAGAENQLVLLDAQRALYAAQDAAVQRQAGRLIAAIDLYRALGGGWSIAMLE